MYRTCTYIILFKTEPYIRIGVLNNLASLLDRNSEFSDEGEDMVTENEERLFDVPIMMLTDINQQVCMRNLFNKYARVIVIQAFVSESYRESLK